MIDQFHRELRARLDKMAQSRRETILRGFGDNAESIALKYKQDTGYLNALQDVMDQCIEVEKKIYSGQKEDN